MFTLWRIAFRGAGMVCTPIRNITLLDAATLRSATEIAPPQLFLYVNRSLIRYDFRGGTKAIRLSVYTYPIYNSFLWRGVPSLRHRNRAATTVLVCEQKPYLVRFSWRCKSDPILTLYGRWAVVQANLRNKINFLSAYRHIHGTWGPHKRTLVTVLKAGA